MSNDIRQGVHFDLDTKALEKYYPKVAWRTAYDDIKSFMENNGFEHEQGSGYHSKEAMIRSEAIKIIRKMIKNNLWLNKCVKTCTIADMPSAFDISGIFNKNVKISDRMELLVKRNKQERIELAAKHGFSPEAIDALDKRRAEDKIVEPAKENTKKKDKSKENDKSK